MQKHCNRQNGAKRNRAAPNRRSVRSVRSSRASWLAFLRCPILLALMTVLIALFPKGIAKGRLVCRCLLFLGCHHQLVLALFGMLAICVRSTFRGSCDSSRVLCRECHNKLDHRGIRACCSLFRPRRCSSGRGRLGVFLLFLFFLVSLIFFDLLFQNKWNLIPCSANLYDSPYKLHYFRWLCVIDDFLCVDW